MKYTGDNGPRIFYKNEEGKFIELFELNPLLKYNKNLSTIKAKITAAKNQSILNKILSSEFKCDEYLIKKSYTEKRHTADDMKQILQKVLNDLDAFNSIVILDDNINAANISLCEDVVVDYGYAKMRFPDSHIIFEHQKIKIRQDAYDEELEDLYFDDIDKDYKIKISYQEEDLEDEEERFKRYVLVTFVEK